MERYAITCRPAAPEITVSSQVFSQEEEAWLSLTVRHVSLRRFYTSFNQAGWQKYILIYNGPSKGAAISGGHIQYNHCIVLQATAWLRSSSRGFSVWKTVSHLTKQNEKVFRYSVTATCFQFPKINLMNAIKIYWPINKINHLRTFSLFGCLFQSWLSISATGYTSLLSMFFHVQTIFVVEMLQLYL